MRVTIQLPPEYRADPIDASLLVSHTEAREAASAALRSHGTLYDWAAESARTPALEGRAPVHVVQVGRERWAVRRYHRGGAVARFLGDRYLDRGVPRPARELLASDAAIRRGVPTPPVRAFAIYPDGIFYRADLATRCIPASVDLAAVLFRDHRKPGVRERAAAAAGTLVRLLAERGVVHPDLNLKNVLIAWRTEPEPRAYLVDLDRCRILPRAGEADRARMLRRFWRSADKWERRTGRSFRDAERAAFEAAYRDGGDAG